MSTEDPPVPIVDFKWQVNRSFNVVTDEDYVVLSLGLPTGKKVSLGLTLKQAEQMAEQRSCLSPADCRAEHRIERFRGKHGVV